MQKSYSKYKNMSNITNNYPGYNASSSPERREGLTSYSEKSAPMAMRVRKGVVQGALEVIELAVSNPFLSTQKIEPTIAPSVTRAPQNEFVKKQVATDSKLDRSGAGRNAIQTNNATNSVAVGGIPTDVTNAYSEVESRASSPVDPLAVARARVSNSFNSPSVTAEDLVNDPRLSLGE
jgi:hypothetical protein